MRKWSVVLALVFVLGCGESQVPGGSAGTTVVVKPGQSIQAAINAAAPGTTITVEPGVYHESAGQPIAVTITKNDVQLIGNSTPTAPVVLEASNGQRDGIWVSPADSVDAPDDEHPICGTNGALLNNFMLKGFTVRGFSRFGVYLACNDGYRLTKNIADGNLVYGLFPVRSHNGTLRSNEVLNSTKDAAIYVGQSDHITVAGNKAHDSLIGIEIENSNDVTVTGNETYADTVGLLADILPGLQQEGQNNVMFSGNNVHDNNRPNTAEPGDLIGGIPAGSGIVNTSGSNITFQNNTVSNNHFAGIVVVSYCTAETLIGGSCSNLDFEPDPENVHVINNQLNGNGTMPPADFAFAGLAADLIWDNTGTGNCWSGNTTASGAPPTQKSLNGHPLPACT